MTRVPWWAAPSRVAHEARLRLLVKVGLMACLAMWATPHPRRTHLAGRLLSGPQLPRGRAVAQGAAVRR